MIQKQEISQYSTNILKKPWLLTIIGVFAIGHIGIMAFKNNVLAICVFFAVTFMLSFFTEFWVVILCVSMVISGCFHFKIDEGFQNENTIKTTIADPYLWADTKLKLLDKINDLQKKLKIQRKEISLNKDKIKGSNQIFKKIKKKATKCLTK